MALERRPARSQLHGRRETQRAAPTLWRTVAQATARGVVDNARAPQAAAQRASWPTAMKPSGADGTEHRHWQKPLVAVRTGLRRRVVPPGRVHVPRPPRSVRQVRRRRRRHTEPRCLIDCVQPLNQGQVMKTPRRTGPGGSVVRRARRRGGPRSGLLPVHLTVAPQAGRHKIHGPNPPGPVRRRRPVRRPRPSGPVRRPRPRRPFFQTS